MGDNQEKTQDRRLEALRRKIEKWRRTRAKRSAMPEPLWEAAVTLARDHGVYGTVRALGINYDGLKKRYETGGGAAEKRARGKGATFVEVKPAVMGMGGMPMGPVVELTTAEGQKLTVRLCRAEDLEGTVTALVHACRREG